MKRLAWLTLPALLSTAVPAFADPPASAPAGAPAPRVERIRSRVLRDKVGLTEDKARKVEAVLDKYAPERKRLGMALRDARQKLRALLVLNSEDEGAYRAALDALRTNRKALADLMDRAFTEIGKELTAKEQAKLFVALERMRGLGARWGRLRGAAPRP